jgi:hypothetical protein
MVSLVFIVCLLLAILCFRVSDYRDTEGGGVILTLISFALLIWIGHLVVEVGTGHTIDEKIAMYEEENRAIEESIDATVKAYMEFEANTYVELKDKDSMNLVSLFPELKSDTLVQQQIEVYVSNNNQIKELKEEKIELSRAKFKLYFGK